MTLGLVHFPNFPSCYDSEEQEIAEELKSHGDQVETRREQRWMSARVAVNLLAREGRAG